MSFYRWMLGLPFAAVVTAGLFLLMAFLIRSEAPVDGGSTDPIISILGETELTFPGPKSRPVAPTDAPPVIETKWNTDPGDKSFSLEAPTPERVDRIDDGGFGYVRPIIKIAPQYPEACRARGAEGAVIVQFDITESGATANARVISSSNTCLNAAAVKAVLGWKYPPNARRGVTESFVFTLTD